MQQIRVVDFQDAIVALTAAGCTFDHEDQVGIVYVFPPPNAAALVPFEVIGPEWRSMRVIPAAEFNSKARKLGLAIHVDENA
jgi:hypothetical protein